MSTKLRHDIARNYAVSFAVAIRNAVDPQDPDGAHYLGQLAPRLKDALDYADPKGIDRAALAQSIIDAVTQELEWLTTGAAARLRDEIARRQS